MRKIPEIVVFFMINSMCSLCRIRYGNFFVFVVEGVRQKSGFGQLVSCYWTTFSVKLLTPLFFKSPGEKWWPMRSSWACLRLVLVPRWRFTMGTGQHACRPTWFKRSGIISAPILMNCWANRELLYIPIGPGWVVMCRRPLMMPKLVKHTWSLRLLYI